ncbi:Gamma-glutamylputrescine oxidoreductase [Fusarium agapanthi]|uniref:Gamma-glutamylputrescine oxidoreductase n=1 Tax=Fusarium agapanthi TaxID=1803897 RepID=A0A9P5BIT7_9HYPO|nr:Gamma-glutamylputrescine oxidoreductase [Fusarium agapanthi]
MISNYQSAEFPPSADVVIIGSGLSGAFIAHQLLSSSSANKPKSVVMLEARNAASGATGRNGGHIKPDCYRGFTSYSILHGTDVAKAQCEFEAVNYQETAKFIQESNLAAEVDLVQYRSADVYLTPESWKTGLASYNGFKEAGGDVSDIHVLSKAEAEESLRVKVCYGAITFPAASLWPYKLAIAVLRKGLDLGLSLHTNTPVTGVSPGTSGPWKVSTPRGIVMANKVIHATNGYSSYLLPELDGRIIPLKGHVSAIAPPPAYMDQPLTASFAFISNDNYDYLIQRPNPEKYLIWGGGEVAHPKGLSGGFGDCDDRQVVSEVESYILNAPVEIFRDWEESRASSGTSPKGAVAFSWSGIMGLSKDLLPFLGELPGKPGQYLAGGYHGHGMARIFLSCKAFCEKFLGEPTDPRVPITYFDLTSRLKDPIDLEIMDNIA